MPGFQNQSLKEYNTFNIDVKALYSFFVSSDQELFAFLDSPIFKEHRHIVIGGGSNVLFKNDFDGIVIHMQNKGIETVKETDDTIFLKAHAGENWDHLVVFCVNKGYAGIENLSLIPGTVGASPIQNIGAYGVELKDVLYETECIETDTLNIRKLKRDECGFSYRESIFKKELRNKTIILNITLKLNKKHHLKLDYGTLKHELRNIKNPGIKNVRHAEIKIR
jgi:UDP-N-acetylmuramate dehydrogenase